MRQKVNIGTSSLILIFIVLCLATFGLLSLSNAKGDWNLAMKNAEAVRTYYEADRQGEQFVNMVKKTFAEAEKRMEDPKEKLASYYQKEQEIFQTDIDMQYGQALHIELQMESSTDYQILCWNVYIREEYEIDDSVPVWTGEEGSDHG